MKLQLRPIGGEVVDVQLEQLSAGAAGVFTFRRGEHSVEVFAESDADGGGWLRIAGRITRYYAVRKGDRIEVWLDGTIHAFELVDRTPRRATAALAGGPKTTLNAPMPGTVLKINVAAGEAFAAHQPLVIMESMKMEMTLSVPHGGVVKEVTCRPGDLVEMGALLARLEPSEAKSP